MKFNGILIFSSFLIFFSLARAQPAELEISRAEIFDRLEKRAQALAKQMEIMSQEDSKIPLGPIPRFDQEILPPPPSSEPLPPRHSSHTSSVRTLADSLAAEKPDVKVVSEIEPPAPVSEIEPEDPYLSDSEEYVALSSTQELLGDYYILPTGGFVLSSESSVTYSKRLTVKVDPFSVTKNLDNEIGYSLGVKAGIRFDDFFAELGMRFSSLDYKIEGQHTIFMKNPLFLRNPINEKEFNNYDVSYKGLGSVDILNFNAKIGYTYLVNEILSLNASLGLGLSNRNNDLRLSFSNELLQENLGSDFQSSDSISSSEIILSYDLAFSAIYYVAENFLLALGYNYMNMGSISQFDALHLHHFELGMGVNF